MIKLLLVTWSYDDHYDLKNTFIYKSFIANNSESLIQHIHFNRNNYQKLEQEFNLKFGFQYEFILYKIFLLRDKLNDINTEYVIYSDTTDVVCLSDIQQIKFENSSKVLFSSEFHRYPNESTLSNWEPINQYTQSDIINRNFLNSGLYIGKTEKIIELLFYCIENILTKEYKNFGGDQGVYTYCYLNSAQKYIELDSNSNLFLSTYLRSSNEYLLENDRLTHRTNKNSPIFVHDNGWNYGSPKFIEQFKLV